MVQFRDNRQTDLASENPLRGCREQTNQGVVYKGHQSARASAPICHSASNAPNSGVQVAYSWDLVTGIGSRYKGQKLVA